MRGICLALALVSAAAACMQTDHPQGSGSGARRARHRRTRHPRQYPWGRERDGNRRSPPRGNVHGRGASTGKDYRDHEKRRRCGQQRRNARKLRFPLAARASCPQRRDGQVVGRACPADPTPSGAGQGPGLKGRCVAKRNGSRRSRSRECGSGFGGRARGPQLHRSARPEPPDPCAVQRHGRRTAPQSRRYGSCR